MKKDVRKKGDLIALGVLLFVLAAALAFAGYKLFMHFREESLYGDIYDLAEKNGLSIEYIAPGVEPEIEIYFKNDARKSQLTEKYYRFSQELAEYLNQNKGVLDKDEKIRPVILTFGGVDKQSATHSPAAKSTSDTEYIFTEYYCYRETSFNEIGYLKAVRRLLFYKEVTDITGAGDFKELEYLYIKLDPDKRDELRAMLPDCQIEFEEQSSQRAVFN